MALNICHILKRDRIFFIIKQWNNHDCPEQSYCLSFKWCLLFRRQTNKQTLKYVLLSQSAFLFTVKLCENFVSIRGERSLGLTENICYSSLKKSQFPKVQCGKCLPVNCSKYSFKTQNEHLTIHLQTLGSLNQRSFLLILKYLYEL